MGGAGWDVWGVGRTPLKQIIHSNMFGKLRILRTYSYHTNNIKWWPKIKTIL